MVTETVADAPLPTIWTVPDALWARIARILAERDPPPRRGRRRADPRPILDTIRYRLRTGCQWNHLPRALADDATAHRTLQRWVRCGVFVRIWADLIAACAALGGVNWEWQAADTALGKARSGGISSGGTRRIAARRARRKASSWTRAVAR